MMRKLVLSIALFLALAGTAQAEVRTGSYTGPVITTDGRNIKQVDVKVDTSTQLVTLGLTVRSDQSWPSTAIWVGTNDFFVSAKSGTQGSVGYYLSLYDGGCDTIVHPSCVYMGATNVTPGPIYQTVSASLSGVSTTVCSASLLGVYIPLTPCTNVVPPPPPPPPTPTPTPTPRPVPPSPPPPAPISPPTYYPSYPSPTTVYSPSPCCSSTRVPAITAGGARMAADKELRNQFLSWRRASFHTLSTTDHSTHEYEFRAEWRYHNRRRQRTVTVERTGYFRYEVDID